MIQVVQNVKYRVHTGISRCSRTVISLCSSNYWSTFTLLSLQLTASQVWLSDYLDRKWTLHQIPQPWIQILLLSLSLSFSISLFISLPVSPSLSIFLSPPSLSYSLSPSLSLRLSPSLSPPLSPLSLSLPLSPSLSLPLSPSLSPSLSRSLSPLSLSLAISLSLSLSIYRYLSHTLSLSFSCIYSLLSCNAVSNIILIVSQFERTDLSLSLSLRKLILFNGITIILSYLLARLLDLWTILHKPCNYVSPQGIL